MFCLKDRIGARLALAFALGLGGWGPAFDCPAGEGVRRSADLVIRSWGTQEGLPQNTVNTLLQTRDGYLWVGTRDGLARFDGVRFSVFGLRDGLQSVEVLALHEDHQGTLWIGTGGGGLSRFVNGQIQSLGMPQRSVSDDIITALAEDAEGRLWIGTAGGLSLWHNGAFVHDGALATLEQTPVRTLLRDRNGGMWIATLGQGLFEYRNGQLTASAGPTGSEKILAYCLMEDQSGQLWAGIGNGIVLCRREAQWRAYDRTQGVPYAYITSLAQEADGTIWAGSLDDGLYRYEGDRFYPVRKEDGLSGNDIRALRPDREGNLWVGTRTGGLNRLSRPKVIACGGAQGLTNDFTRSVAETEDGTLWVGTIGGGLYRGGPGEFRPFAPEPVMAFYASVDSVLAARNGTLWWGGARALLCWRDGRLAGCYTNEPWVKSASVTALCEDRQGGLWIGTSESKVVHWDGDRFTEFPARVARGPVAALAQQPNGVLWVGSAAGGLKRVRPTTGEVESVTNGLISQAVRALYLERDGTLWIGTAGGGLSRWREGRIATLTSRHGLGADTVSQIIEDDDGNLWLGCSRGIFRVSKAALNEFAEGKVRFVHPRSFGENDGMPAEECSSGFCPAGLKTKSGLLCFSTVKGLVFLDPRRLEAEAPAPSVLLEEVLVNGTAWRTQAQVAPSANAAPAPARESRLAIPPGGREVEVQYTAISFASPEKVSFRYRLKGLDQDWVEAGARRSAFYHRIPPGDFAFEVTACNADGIWSEGRTVLLLRVQPYLWETPWFSVGIGVLAVGLFAGLLRFLEARKYQQRLALLQTQHAIERERLRISKDMHDDIGSILTQVTQLSDLGQSEAGEHPGAGTHFERIGAQTRVAVQALDEIVWATNPKNDNLPRFAEYVGRFADECFEASSVRCWQQMPTELPNLPLGADTRHNVFLAVKESLTNVLKHAQATEVWLRLSLNGGMVELEIEDNGLGFSISGIATGGNGLENMRTRLAETGGRFELTSVHGQGTKVRFVFPVSPAR